MYFQNHCLKTTFLCLFRLPLSNLKIEEIYKTQIVFYVFMVLYMLSCYNFEF